MLRLDARNSNSLRLAHNGGSTSLRPAIVGGPQGLPGPGSAAWTAAQAVTTGSVRQAPDGSWIKSTGNRTTRGSFDATEQTFWTAVLGTSGTIEATSLTAAYGAQLETDGTPANVAATGLIKDRELAPKVRFIDTWNSSIFDAGLNKWVVGQFTSTTVTITGAVSAGATVIPLSDVTGISAGVCFVTNGTAATYQVHRVVSVAGSDVTVAHPVVTPLTNGQAIQPLWSDTSHITNGFGYPAWVRSIVHAQDANLDYLIDGTAPKVSVFGNSWMVRAGSNWQTILQERIPGATVTNNGVNSNTTALMAARLADIPSDSTHVVIFEWVNDSFLTTPNTAANIETIVRYVRNLGAVPILVGPVPVQPTYPATVVQERRVVAQVGDSSTWPAVDWNAVLNEVANAAIGNNDVSNVLTGSEALGLLTTGVRNTGFGQRALRSVTTGLENTAVGNSALYSAVSTNDSTGVGHAAGFLATGNFGTFLGRAAGYLPKGVVGNASTTGICQTCVGAESGQGSAAVSSYITTIGYRATAIGNGAFAIGTDSAGTGASATAANEGVLGTANHTIKILGKFSVAPRTPASASATGTAGEIAWDTDYIYICTASNTWKRVAVATW